MMDNLDSNSIREKIDFLWRAWPTDVKYSNKPAAKPCPPPLFHEYLLPRTSIMESTKIHIKRLPSLFSYRSSN